MRRLIEALLLPIGLSALLTISGILFRRRLVALAGPLVLYILSTPLLGELMVHSLESVYQARSVAAGPDADAIVVLSGGVVRGVAEPGVQWGESANRYFAGVDLLMAGKAKTIVFSAADSQDPGRSQGAILREAAIQRGIQPDRIILTPRVLTTEDEARAVSQIPGVHSILLVTSAFHMPRAVLLFRARGLDVAPFPTDLRVLKPPILALPAFIPSPAALQLSNAAVREYYGLAVYRTILLFRPARSLATPQIPPQRSLAE